MNAKLTESVLEILDSDQRALFLARLVKALAVQGRGYYVSAGETAEEASNAFYCFNELVIKASSQLWETLLGYEPGSHEGYPDETFLQVLEQDAKLLGGYQDHLYAVLNGTVRSLRDLSGKRATPKLVIP